MMMQERSLIIHSTTSCQSNAVGVRLLVRASHFRGAGKCVDEWGNAGPLTGISRNQAALVGVKAIIIAIRMCSHFELEASEPVEIISRTADCARIHCRIRYRQGGTIIVCTRD